MNSRFAGAALAFAALGCQASKPPVSPSEPVAATAPLPTKVVPTETVAPNRAPVVALVEPFLVAVSEPKAILLPPPSLRGSIIVPPDATPLMPAPPTETTPIAPPSGSPAPAPSTTPNLSKPAPAPSKAAIPPAVVRLLEDERSRSVEEARHRLAAATARATQTTAEAKRQWGFVKDGFVAQKTAEAADAAARDATREQSDAQKALDAAAQRQRDARRDLQAAYGVAELPGFAEASLERPLPAYRPVPFTYRLSILGETVKPIVENGTLGRTLPVASGEGGAWIVRCADPARLRIIVGGQKASVVTHPLPKPLSPTTKA